MVLSMLWPIMLCPMFWTMGAPIMVLSMLFPTLPAISSIGIGIGWLVLSTLLSIMFLSMLWPIMLCPMFWTMSAPIMVLSMLFPTLPAISSIGSSHDGTI